MSNVYVAIVIFNLCINIYDVKFRNGITIYCHGINFLFVDSAMFMLNQYIICTPNFFMSVLSFILGGEIE